MLAERECGTTDPLGRTFAAGFTVSVDMAGSRAPCSKRKADRDPPYTSYSYYDEALCLFGEGWVEGRYRFDDDGNLWPRWVERG